MRLYVHEWGDPGGRPVVCIHGNSSGGVRFARLASGFLAERRVLAVDLRGHGRSGYEPPWRLETFVGDVLETVDALGVGAADWIGHSFGGRIAYTVAAAQPERVERLVLLDAAVGQVDGERALAVAEYFCGDESYGSVEEAVAAWRAALARAPDELVRESVEDSLELSDDGRHRWRYCRSAAIAAVGELASPPPRPARVPTLCLVGADSALVTDDHRARLGAELGDLLSEVAVPGGHQVLLDALPETGAAVREFLAA